MKNMIVVLKLIAKKVAGIICLFIFIGSFAWLLFFKWASMEFPDSFYSKNQLIDIGNVWASEGMIFQIKDGKISKVSPSGSYTQASSFMVGVGNILWIASSGTSLLAGILLLKGKNS